MALIIEIDRMQTPLKSLRNGNFSINLKERVPGLRSLLSRAGIWKLKKDLRNSFSENLYCNSCQLPLASTSQTQYKTQKSTYCLLEMSKTLFYCQKTATKMLCCHKEYTKM